LFLLQLYSNFGTKFDQRTMPCCLRRESAFRAKRKVSPAA
jgi:hypothetical protein